MANTTMTMRDFFNAILNNEIFTENGEISPEITAICAREIEKIDNKNKKRRETVSKNQEANIELKDIIFARMENNVIYSAAKIVELVKDIGNFSTQKITPIMKNLVADGSVTLTTYKEKGKSKVNGYIIKTEMNDEVSDE